MESTGVKINGDMFGILTLLSDGRARSTREIVFETKAADPRSSIRNLRKSGVKVMDYWVQNSDGVRFKKYYIG